MRNIQYQKAARARDDHLLCGKLISNTFMAAPEAGEEVETAKSLEFVGENLKDVEKN